MKPKIFCLFLFIGVLSLLSAEQQYCLPADGQWENCDLYNMEKRVGQKGLFQLSLKNKSYEATAQTDLLLHFNPQEAEPPFYELIQPCRIKESPTAIGGYCASFSAITPSMQIKPKAGAWFFPGERPRDFTLEFRLLPNALVARENVFYWNNAFLFNDRILHQEISCILKNRKVEWNFKNFFGNEGRPPVSFSLTTLTELTPGQWSHQAVRYDAASGKMMLLMDGRIEAVRYVTDSGDANGEKMTASVGNNVDAVVEIGRLFSGLMDEIRLERSAEVPFYLKPFGDERGILLTRPIDLGYTHSSLTAVAADVLQVADSPCFYYYRLTDDRSQKLQWESDTAAGYAKGNIPANWTPFTPGKGFSGPTRGRYVQILAELYADSSQSMSSVLRSLQVCFVQDRPPIPPIGVVALPLDGAVELVWNSVADNDLAGYLIYWGEGSGFYFGNNGSQASPVDVGNQNHYRIEKLTNGKLYFFAIVAYDNSWGKSENAFNHKSEFSSEVFARPARIYGNGAN